MHKQYGIFFFVAFLRMWINWIVSRWARCISFYLSLSIALWHIDECRHSLQSLLFWRIMHTQYSQKYAPLKAIKFETQSRMNKLKSKTKWKILFNSGENFPKCTKPHNSIHMELILCANEESKKKTFHRISIEFALNFNFLQFQVGKKNHEYETTNDYMVMTTASTPFIYDIHHRTHTYFAIQT